MSDESRNGNQLERVLEAQQKRVLSALVNDSSRPADPILREGEFLDSEEHLTVCYELHHVLLPALEDERLVEFDSFKGEVRRGPRFTEVYRFLDQIEDSSDE